MTDDRSASDDWERRVAALWATFDDSTSARDFRAAVDRLADELPAESAIGTFERACAYDSTGSPDLAAALYRAALTTGLEGLRRRRAVIQLASSLRNLGRARESVALLRAEREAASDDLDDAVVAFLALALVDTGCEREAAGLALARLAPHLKRYTRSLANYAEDFIPTAGGGES